MNQRQKEIEEGKSLLERFVRNVADDVDAEWHPMSDDQPTPKKTSWTDGWVLTLRRGLAERQMEFDNDELSDLPAMGEMQHQVIREIRNAIAGLGH